AGTQSESADRRAAPRNISRRPGFIVMTAVVREADRHVPIPAESESAYLVDPDVQLMLRVKQGDEEAFARLVATYQDRLVSIFANLVGDQETAEDLTQEVFLRIYRARHGYQPNAKFATWVFRIANNLASNSRRS